MESGSDRFVVASEGDAEAFVGPVVVRSAAAFAQAIAAMIFAAAGVLGGGAMTFAAVKRIVVAGGNMPWSAPRGNNWFIVLILLVLGALAMGFGAIMAYIV